MDLSIRIGGEAGQGIQSISSIIARTFVRHDFYVFINQNFESRIRGGHNFDQVRISTDPVRAAADKVQILIALDKDTTRQDIECLAENGFLLFDGDAIDFTSDHPNHLSVPFSRIASDVAKSKIMINAVAIGAAIALLNFERQPVLDCLQEQFQQKGAETIENNQKCMNAGYDFVRRNLNENPPFGIPSAKLARQKMLLTGSQSIALGAMASGLKFYSGYPMSPSTAIMEFISSHAAKYSIVVDQGHLNLLSLLFIRKKIKGIRSSLGLNW